MKHSDTEATIKAAEQKSSVLRETSEDLNRESLDLRFESLRLREKSRKLVEEVKKHIRPKKLVRSAGEGALIEKHEAGPTLAGNQNVKAAGQGH